MNIPSLATAGLVVLAAALPAVLASADCDEPASLASAVAGCKQPEQRQAGRSGRGYPQPAVAAHAVADAPTRAPRRASAGAHARPHGGPVGPTSASGRV